jgi:hypothetical protein
MSLADLMRITSNILSGVGHIAVGLWLLSDAEGGSALRRFDVVPTPLQPLPTFSAAWGVIFFGMTAYLTQQARPERWQDPLLRRIGWLTATALLAAVLWFFVRQTGPMWLSIMLLIVMLATLLRAHLVAATSGGSTAADRLGVVAPLGMYAGWTAAMVAIAVAGAAQHYGVVLADFALIVILIGLAAGARIVLRINRGEPCFAIGVCWPLGGIAAANILLPTPSGGILIAAVAAALALELLAFTAAQQRSALQG